MYASCLLTTVITDAGAKSLGMDQKTYSREYPGTLQDFNEEHPALYILSDKQIGDILFIVPGHCCTAVSLHGSLCLFRGNRIVDCLTITGRGKNLLESIFYIAKEEEPAFLFFFTGEYSFFGSSRKVKGNPSVSLTAGTSPYLKERSHGARSEAAGAVFTVCGV